MLNFNKLKQREIKMIREYKLSKLFIYSIIFILFGCQNKKTETAINLTELTISKIHQAYVKGDYSSQQLVAAYLQRIKTMDQEINSLTTINSQALSIAIALDEEFKKTKVLRPLHGIPLIVKDNINTKGLPTTGGSLALKDFIPEQDAFIIKKLKDAGAIIIAKSNMAEWAFSAKHTESSTAGTTRNPYNLDHVPAGSSGGTAASIASNFGVIGLGTDTGNSIRGPSSHNALVGFRTTIGLISRSAIIPLILRNDVVGPMTRTVEDATKTLEIMVGYDPDDPITKYSNGKIPNNYQQFLVANGLENARIGIFRSIDTNGPELEIQQLFNQAVVDMQSLGATIIDPLDIPNFHSLKKEQWCSEFRQDLEEYLANYVKNDSIQTLKDITNIGTQSKYAKKQLAMFSKNKGRFGNKGTPCKDAYNDQLRIAFRQGIEKVMDELNLDAIVYPSWNNKPAHIALFEEEYKGDNNQIIAPHTGQPAFTVPMGYTSGNLPIGLQFLGRMYAEPTLIKLAYAFEQGTKHRKPPKSNPK